MNGAQLAWASTASAMPSWRARLCVRFIEKKTPTVQISSRRKTKNGSRGGRGSIDCSIVKGGASIATNMLRIPSAHAETIFLLQMVSRPMHMIHPVRT